MFIYTNGFREMEFVVPRPKKEDSEVEGVLKSVMSKSRKYQQSLPKSTKRSKEVYRVDNPEKIIKIPADPKIYGSGQFLDYVECRIEKRFD